MQNSGEEHSEELLKIFNQEAKQEMATEWSLQQKREHTTKTLLSYMRNFKPWK